MAAWSYKQAGVDLDRYAESMQRIGSWVQRTHTPRVVPWPDGFAGLFRLDFDCCLFARRYEKPILVGCADGVGTKLLVAEMAGKHDTVGIDLVAMNVNDCICSGAEPLFFLDYVAMGRDDPELLEQIVQGVARGCQQADCALLGGETAVMPDLYPPGRYDLAGFCVGVVEEHKRIDGSAVESGDVVLGVASSGFHSNGYSLVRKVVFEHARLKVDQYVEELQATVAEVLLRPTTIYAPAVRSVLQHYRVKAVVHALAHITGGGLAENLARVVPQGKQVLLRRGSWPVPAEFAWLAELGQVAEEEMYRVFNMGIGLVLVVSPYYAASIRQQLSRWGFASWEIGRVRQGEQPVVWSDAG